MLLRRKKLKLELENLELQNSILSMQKRKQVEELKSLEEESKSRAEILDLKKTKINLKIETLQLEKIVMGRRILEEK